MSKINLVYNTIKYLRFRQFAYRGWYLLKKKVKKKPYKAGYSFTKINRISGYYSHEYVSDRSISIAEDILNNKFPFYAGEKIELSDGDWELKNNTYRLKCFKLNSCDWLRNLNDAYMHTGDKKYIDKGIALIDEWISKERSGINGDKWNPYVTANRILNFIGFLSVHADDEELYRYAKHISLAIRELRSNIEYQLGANHLLSEAKALMFGGYFINNKDIYNYGKNLLVDEYKEQFLEDGGHYERSISYHVEALEQYFEAAYLMNYNRDKDFETFSKMIKNSYIFLHNMIEVNGKIPLFNDAADDYTWDAADFLSTGELLYASKSPRAVCGQYYHMWQFDNVNRLDIDWKEIDTTKTGIYKDLFLEGNLWYDIMMDVGDNGPDYNLGHTHADALSIVLTSSKGRIIADSGVFTYNRCDERNKCRKTSAHNTIEIDSMDSAEVWGAFRTGKRGHTKLLKKSHSTDKVSIKAVSDGYAKVLHGPVFHTREYVRQTGDNSIILRDTINSKNRHKGVLRFFLAPTVTYKLLDEHSILLDENIYLECTEIIKIEECKIAQNFGECSETYCIKSDFDIDGDKEITTKIHFRKERS